MVLLLCWDGVNDLRRASLRVARVEAAVSLFIFGIYFCYYCRVFFLHGSIIKYWKTTDLIILKNTGAVVFLNELNELNEFF